MPKPWGLHAQLGGARPKVEELKGHGDNEIYIKAQWRTPSARAPKWSDAQHIVQGFRQQLWETREGGNPARRLFWLSSEASHLITKQDVEHYWHRSTGTYMRRVSIRPVAVARTY